MTDDCIISPAYKDKDGYPRLKVGKRQLKALNILREAIDKAEKNCINKNLLEETI